MVVGIDLGTTNSAIGRFHDGKVELFANPLGDLLTPSAVAVEPKTGRLIVGRTARDLVARDPSRGAMRFKPDMGTAKTFAVGDRKLSVVELSAHVLDALRTDAERALGGSVTRAVITVPAYFDDTQRHATRTAAEQAGLHVERILNEPTAAAIAYGLDKADNHSTFAVVDLGGGTFDVCVMELFEGVLQVKGVAGDGRLGGEDFTAAVAEVLSAKAELPPLGSVATSLLYKRAETAKRTLARWPRAEVVLPEAVTGGRERTLELTVEDLDAVWAPMLERLRGPLRAALRGANTRVDQLAEVVLVGGATRMPAVQRVVVELLGREPRHHANPDLLVAEGAAIQAAMIADDKGVGDLVVTDVCSHSLGVATSKQIGGRLMPGYFSPIIHRNTTIPTTRFDSYVTIDDYQKEIRFEVFEGEARRADENRKIGELVARLGNPGLAGHAVRVRFTLDSNGMLEVEATDEKSPTATFSKVFHRQGGELAGAELERARGRLRAIRADPMERPRYRDLFARAKLVWEEAPEKLRPSLGNLIDVFEDAVERRTHADIERAYDALLARVEAIDRGERW